MATRISKAVLLATLMLGTALVMFSPPAEAQAAVAYSISLNLIQTYKSLSIAEGIRLEPNNPVFILKGKK